jgi:hypothetical protein
MLKYSCPGANNKLKVYCTKSRFLNISKYFVNIIYIIINDQSCQSINLKHAIDSYKNWNSQTL